MDGIGKCLLATGIFLAILGAGIILAGRLGIPLGRLPGDIHLQRGRVGFYFPLVTCIVLSLAFTFLLWLVQLAKK